MSKGRLGDDEMDDSTATIAASGIISNFLIILTCVLVFIEYDDSSTRYICVILVLFIVLNLVVILELVDVIKKRC